MNRSIVLIFSFYLSLFSCNQNQYADTIIHGGTIYTVDSTNSVVEAVAIKDGVIFKIGDFSDIKNFMGSVFTNKPIVELNSGLVLFARGIPTQNSLCWLN